MPFRRRATGNLVTMMEPTLWLANNLSAGNA
jgi:hypothetical protein